MAGLTVLLPLACQRRRQSPPTDERQWLDAYVRGCLDETTNSDPIRWC